MDRSRNCGVATLHHPSERSAKSFELVRPFTASTMVRPDYKSFEANDLHMSTMSSDEAEGVALQPEVGNNAPVRGNKSRFLTIALGVLTLAGVVLLVSTKGGSTSKTMLPANGVVVDMHTFETTKAGSHEQHRIYIHIEIKPIITAVIMTHKTDY